MVKYLQKFSVPPPGVRALSDGSRNMDDVDAGGNPSPPSFLSLVGGGLKSAEDAVALLGSGAKKAELLGIGRLAMSLPPGAMYAPG